jgi:hypothetical protein
MIEEKFTNEYINNKYTTDYFDKHYTISNNIVIKLYQYFFYFFASTES